MKVSQRLHNDTYAPGIPTYGISGKTGDKGDPGVSVFFTDYNIEDIYNSYGFNDFADKITSRMLPTTIDETMLDRKYVNGDQFVTRDGKIYRLIDIDKLTRDYANGFDTDEFNLEDYLIYLGIFNKDAGIFKDSNNKLKTNYLILSDTPNEDDPSNGLLTINRKNNVNGSVSFINLNSMYKNMPNINLDIQYDNTLSAFVFKSDYPIVFDANTYFKMDSDTKTSLYGYSPVVYKDNTITNFYGTCKQLSYNLDASIYSYTKKDSSTIYFGCLYMIDIQTDPNENILDNYVADNSSIIVHFQNTQFQDFQVYRKNESTYYFKEDYDEIHLNKLLNNLQVYYLKNIQVSLIDNVEVYLHKDQLNIIGYKIDMNA